MSSRAAAIIVHHLPRAGFQKGTGPTRSIVGRRELTILLLQVALTYCRKVVLATNKVPESEIVQVVVTDVDTTFGHMTGLMFRAIAAKAIAGCVLDIPLLIILALIFAAATSG